MKLELNNVLDLTQKVYHRSDALPLSVGGRRQTGLHMGGFRQTVVQGESAERIRWYHDVKSDPEDRGIVVLTGYGQEIHHYKSNIALSLFSSGVMMVPPLIDGSPRTILTGVALSLCVGSAVLSSSMLLFAQRYGEVWFAIPGNPQTVEEQDENIYQMSGFYMESFRSYLPVRVQVMSTHRFLTPKDSGLSPFPDNEHRVNSGVYSRDVLKDMLKGVLEA
jgi:hypothetical protein